MIKITLLFSLLITAPSVLADNQWVTGDIERIQEYGAYSNSQYHVLISLKNMTWTDPQNGNGDENCIQRFRIKDGAEGVDSDIKNRMFSMLLSAYMAGKQVSLYVNTDTAPYCNVIVTGVGDKLP